VNVRHNIMALYHPVQNWMLFVRKVVTLHGMSFRGRWAY